ncbi:MAG: hypothetical protein IKN42_00305 [Elusimicrobia bacterium]|nr:hypothetical protein [Elusimicrobiota bacterium]
MPNDKVYIYIVGESSSVGEPYSSHISYYKILNYIIGGKINNKNINFIKIAYSGDNIKTQYWKYLIYRYTHPFRKGLVFIYAGKNDWDNGKNEDCLIDYKSKLFELINTIFRSYIREGFKSKYEKLIMATKNFGDIAFVTTIAGNYSGFMPHLDADNIQYKEEFNRIDDEILISKNYEKALEKLRNLEEKKDSDKSWIYYRYGKIAEFTGKIKEANDYYIKGICLYSNLIPTKYQIECVRNLAKKYNLTLVDIFDKVYNSGKIIGFNFYKDNQHPDIKLYITIAELFANALKEKYGDKINIEKNNVSEEEVYKYFNFDENGMYFVYRHSLDVTLVHSKENDNVNRYVFEQVDEYLRKIIELNPYDGEQRQAIISFYSMMVEALKGNKEKMIEIYSNHKDIIENNKYNIYTRFCDWKEYNQWVSNYLGIEDFFDLKQR